MRSITKTICLSACVLAFVATSYAQSGTISLQNDNSPTITLYLVPHFNPLFGLGYVNPEKSIIEVAEGSQYFDEEFKTLQIQSSEETIKARYNAFLDEMEIKKDDQLGWLNKYLHRDKIVFATDGKAFKILDADARAHKMALGYFEVLLDKTKVSLYKKDKKKLAVGLENSQYMIPVPEVITEFQAEKTEYYIELGKNGNALKLPRTRRGVARLFGEKSDIVKNFMKENKLKVTRDDDLIKIIEFVNTL